MKPPYQMEHNIYGLSQLTGLELSKVKIKEAGFPDDHGHKINESSA